MGLILKLIFGNSFGHFSNYYGKLPVGQTNQFCQYRTVLTIEAFLVKSGNWIVEVLQLFFFPLQGCFGYSCSFALPYKFWDRLVNFCNKAHWDLIGMASNLQINIDIIPILSLLILERDIYFHVFRSSVSLSSVLQFPQYRSYTYFIKHIPKYFLFAAAI